MKTRSSFRPLTKLMEKKLTECRDMESNGVPCLPKHFGASLSGLYKRKLIDIRPIIINGKEVMCAFVTPDGKTYIEKITARTDSQRLSNPGESEF